MTTNIIETPKSTKKQPFSSSERELIIALVCDRPIIECKQTNAKNIELKKQAWEDLTLAYNSQPYVSQRTSTQLKRCWENIKTQRKKELSQESAYMMGTGGGPPQAGTSNIIDIICPHINFQVPGVIDSNTIEISDDVNKENSDVIELPDEKVLTNITNVKESKKKFLENTPSQPKKKCLRPDGSSRNNMLTTEAEARVHRCTKNIQNDEELHEVRLQREKIILERENNLLKFEKELHDLQIEKIKLEIEILKKKQ